LNDDWGAAFPNVTQETLGRMMDSGQVGEIAAALTAAEKLGARRRLIELYGVI
jgi:hypothetical protein